MRAGLGDAEDAARHQHLAAPAAGRGRFASRSALHAGAAAGFTGVLLGDGDFLFTAVGGFLQRHLQVVTQILAPMGLRRVAAPAEEAFKNAVIAAEHLAENVKRVVKAPAPAAGALTRVKGGVAELIVRRTFLGVAQRFIGLPQFLETFLGAFVPGIFVRMKFDREFAVGFLDFLRVRLAGDPEDFIIIALGHG